MKLLLTSAGIKNPSIAKALLELVGKPAKDTVIAFIPTAANFDRGNKSWLIDNLWELKQLNFKAIDIVDISALPMAVWLPRIQDTDVLLFSGGNSSHLMYWMKQSGLANLLPDLLKSKVYAGISAGSVITAPSLTLSNEEKKISYKEKTDYDDNTALALVDFYFRPHLNSSVFPNVTEENLRVKTKEIKEKIYAVDDRSALKVVDGKVEIVGEGEVLELN